MVRFSLVAYIAVFVSVSADGALVARSGGQAVYDTDRNLTLLANANLADTMPYSVGVNGIGLAEWDEAVAWIGALNADNHLGINSWRLPAHDEMDMTCVTTAGGSSPASDSSGFSCTGSDLGHLFYEELDGTAGQPISSSSDPDLGLFSNIQDARYWTGTTDSTNVLNAWAIGFNNGNQSSNGKVSDYYIWPVANGDVLVPIPAAFYLFASGVFGLAATSRQSKRYA